MSVPVSVTQTDSSWWSPSPESNSESFGVRLWNAALFSLPLNPLFCTRYEPCFVLPEKLCYVRIDKRGTDLGLSLTRLFRSVGASFLWNHCARSPFC
ncbi:hypothetical protein EK904_000917 [Melospiza melodia maxima]|nr:hypothetical protein EK904_000917 [Melospiza melodia maxima]